MAIGVRVTVGDKEQSMDELGSFKFPFGVPSQLVRCLHICLAMIQNIMKCHIEYSIFLEKTVDRPSHICDCKPIKVAHT